MKKILLAAVLATSLAFTSCETTKELIINPDGSGSISSSIDLGPLIGLAKMSPEGLGELEGKKMDTLISFKSITDSIEALSAEERALGEKGTFNMKMDVDNDIFQTMLAIPFANVTEAKKVDALITKSATGALITALSNQGSGADELNDIPAGSYDDYFDMEYTKTSISKKLNTDKHAKVGEDESMEALRELAGQGMAPTNKIIIRLPRPAKKTEGKGLAVSDDKKTITINESASDFLEDPKSLEFLIEY